MRRLSEMFAKQDISFLEKEMATHSSILAWRISWTEELGGLQSTGRLSNFTFTFTLLSSQHRVSTQRMMFIIVILRVYSWDLSAGPVAKILSSQCRGPGFDPWSGN